MQMPYVDATIARARTTARARGIDAARREWFDDTAWFDVIRRNPVKCRAAEHWRMIEAFGGAPWLDSASPAHVEPIAERIGAITAPVLLMNGAHDLPEFVHAADLLEARLPNCHRGVVPNAGGFPLWEFPDDVNRRVEWFLYDREGFRN
jgi:pimeloyl-ACP methyl ester carboxylesterase